MYMQSYNYYYPYYDPNMQMMPAVYDPTMYMYQQQLQQQQYHPQPQYEGHKSRSNSVSHQSDFNHSTPQKSSPEIVPDTSVQTSEEAPSSSVPPIVEPESAPVAEPVSTNGTLGSEVKADPEGEGWERGKALLVEVSEKQGTEPLPETGPSPWKRGISMPEKTPAQMLLRQDNIARYSREMIISFHIFGINPVPDILLALYGTKYTSTERAECKPLSGPAPKSPNKNRRDKSRREELVEEPHPDEKTFFHAKTDGVFRYDPNRVVEANTPDSVIHKATEILNKLSVESFERLSDQFLNIGMETEEIMGRVVDLIVSKAQMEEHFCFMYADLCKKITEKWVSEEVPEDQAAAASEDTSALPNLGKAFRTRLLTRCQEEFQQDREAAMQAVMELQIPEEDKEEKLFVLKKRYTGHMRFVGEIYMKDLLKPTKLYLCIEDLLATRDEEKLSCLCKLMQTIGKKLEAYDQKKKKGKFRDYFNSIAALSADKSLSTKVRFAFKDLIEMRNNNWTARRTEEKAKKLSEIRSEINVSTPTSQGPPSAQMKSRPPSDVRSLPNAAPVDEWNLVPQKGKRGSAPPPKVTPGPPRPGRPSPVATTNKFSALNTVSSNRGGKVRSRREEEEEEGITPTVSIPHDSSVSTFSPNGEGEDMSPMTRESQQSPTIPGADGYLDEVLTGRV